MAELGWPTLEVMQEHLQNLISQGYMIAAELATYFVPKDHVSPDPVGDSSWRAQHSMSEDSVCHHIDFFAPCCSSIDWSCIT
jgi:hypothetical protein